MDGQSDYGNFHQKVNMYLDNEMSTEAANSFLREASKDPGYHRVLQKEKSFRNFIKNNVHRPNVTPDFIQSIKDKIRVV
ncbi:MAG: hypothetical protein EA409_03165 [Saprospirales bacterium]|jgi:ribosome maturation factor RimP|nr:MAG: hypothetical protein EA409_03165 [Saprospirales bacterium]